MDTSSEYAFDQDQASSLIDNTYPMPGEPSSKTLHREGELPPPGREQGVESNEPGSEPINIRDDEGSSVTPSNSGGDALDDMPPLPPNHKHSPPAPRKAGPASPETTPATASSKGHQSAAEKAASDFSDEDVEEEFSDERKPAKNVDLAPSPELSEQQAYERATEQYEDEVERLQEKAAERDLGRETERDSEDMEPTRDPVFGRSAEGETEAERALEKELAAEEQHIHAAHASDASNAIEEADEAAEAEEEAMLAEQSELAAEQAEAEGLNRPPSEDVLEG